jgi:hypothetical protein
MVHAQHQEKYDQQTRDLFAALGRFVVGFELVCRHATTVITMALSKAGLRDQQYANILLADLTADPIKKTMIAVVAHAIQPIGKDAKVLQAIAKQFQQLIEARNELLHSTWYVGWANDSQSEFDVANAVKLKKSKDGVVVKKLDYKIEDFDRHTTEAEMLSKIIVRLNGCIVGGHSLAKNFTLTPQGGVEC